jgi:hypothetical protein
MIQTADEHYQDISEEETTDTSGEETTDVSAEETTINGHNIMYQYTLMQPETGSYLTFNPGDDVGYILADFVVPDELTANAGESVAAVLTRIKELLGNYEFFYDEFGVFHFREIKNYLNTTQGKMALKETSENQYLVETNNSKSIYTFTDTGNITSINVTPHYENIKNDYVVLGLRKSTTSDIGYEVRYHLAIDDKPLPIGYDEEEGYYYAEYGVNEILVLFSEKNEYGYTGNIVAGFARSVENLPEIGNLDDLYYCNGTVYY